MEDIIIEHPTGDISLTGLQLDVNSARVRYPNKDTFTFNTDTVQALINKIVKQDTLIQQYESIIK